MHHISRLDSLRAYCILAVFAFHAGYLPCGWVGVQAFFVLSGYLITGILLRQKNEKNWKVFFLTFYARRSLRIFPAYYFFLLVLTAFAVFNLTRGKAEPIQFWTSLPFLASYTENLQSINDNYVNTGLYSHLWTLSIEEQFYLIWPFVIFITPRRMLIYVCITIILFCAGFRVGLLWYGGSEHFRHFAADRISFSQFDAFACGAIIHSLQTKNRWYEKGWSFCVSCLIMLALGGVILIIAHRESCHLGIRSLGYTQDFPVAGAFVWAYTALNLFFAHLIVVISDQKKASRGLFLRIFEFSWMKNLGLISYGFYIYHDPILDFVKKLRIGGSYPYHISDVGMNAFALIFTVLVSYISYIIIELPFLRLKRHWRYSEPSNLSIGSSVSRTE